MTTNPEKKLPVHKARAAVFCFPLSVGTTLFFIAVVGTNSREQFPLLQASSVVGGHGGMVRAAASR